MPQEQYYKVITTRTDPGHDSNPSTVSEDVLSVMDLSARYPRESTRYGGSLVLARYEVQTGEYDAETYEERITSADRSEELTEDPRQFDTEVDPSKMPEGYVVGEGYGQWQARVNGGEYQHGGRYYTSDGQSRITT